MKRRLSFHFTFLLAVLLLDMACSVPAKHHKLKNQKPAKNEKVQIKPTHSTVTHLPRYERETNLHEKMLLHYDQSVAPQITEDDPVSVDVSLAITNIDDEVHHDYISLHGYVKVQWEDFRLKYDKVAHEINDTRLIGTKIWRPRLALYDKHHEPAPIHLFDDDERNGLAHIHPHGEVVMVLPYSTEVKCMKTEVKEDNHTDEYHCAVKLGSWMYDSHDVDFHFGDWNDDGNVKILSKDVHGGWTFLVKKGDRASSEYSSASVPFCQLIYRFELKHHDDKDHNDDNDDNNDD